MYTSLSSKNIACPHCNHENLVATVTSDSAFVQAKPKHKCKGCGKNFYMRTNGMHIETNKKPWPEINYDVE